MRVKFQTLADFLNSKAWSGYLRHGDEWVDGPMMSNFENDSPEQPMAHRHNVREVNGAFQVIEKQ